MENLVEFVNLYKSYDKKDKNPIQNQYNNAFFLREVQKALIEEKEKSKKTINNVFNCFKEFIYEKFESCKSIRYIMSDLDNIKEKLDEIVRQIAKEMM